MKSNSEGYTVGLAEQAAMEQTTLIRLMEKYVEEKKKSINRIQELDKELLSLQSQYKALNKTLQQLIFENIPTKESSTI